MTTRLGAWPVWPFTWPAGLDLVISDQTTLPCRVLCALFPPSDGAGVFATPIVGARGGSAVNCRQFYDPNDRPVAAAAAESVAQPTSQRLQAALLGTCKHTTASTRPRHDTQTSISACGYCWHRNIKTTSRSLSRVFSNRIYHAVQCVYQPKQQTVFTSSSSSSLSSFFLTLFFLLLSSSSSFSSSSSSSFELLNLQSTRKWDES